MANNVVLVGSAGLGGADQELGGLLLANFLRLLGERKTLPEYVILWNEGVKAAVDGTVWVGYLKKLEERGVKIISCRTCIEYFGLEGKIAAGEIGTMPQIQQILLEGSVLTV